MLMFFKYANVMNLVFVTFIHGVAFPVLWPITLFGIMNNFFTERVLLAYYYRQPPVFDNQLNLIALKIMKLAPLFGLCTSYWYLRNR